MKKALSLILGIQLIVSATWAGGVQCMIDGTCGGYIQTKPVIMELNPGEICKTRAC